MEGSLRCCNNLKSYFLQWSESRGRKTEREVATWRQQSQHTTWDCPADLVCCIQIATFLLLFQPNILSQKFHEHYHYPTQQETGVTSPLSLTHSPAADNLQTLLPLCPHLQQITQIPSNLLPHVSLCLRSQSQQEFPENIPAKQTREVSRSGK